MSKSQPKTVTYQIIWRDLRDLSDRVADLSREEKDREMVIFARKHDRFFRLGHGFSGVEAHVDRNMKNYFTRNHNVDIEKKFRDLASRLTR